MIPRRYVIAGLGIFLAIVLAVVLRPQDDGAVERTRPAANVDTAGTAESEAKSEEEFEGEEGRGGATEAQEEAEVKEKRLEALAEAKAGQVRPEDRRDDCAGHRLGRLAGPSSNFDDWEPAVATDPKAPYIYLLTTRYAEGDCGVHCPTPWIPLTVSSDGGATWSPQAPICQCDRSKAQYDPTTEVVPNTGAVFPQLGPDAPGAAEVLVPHAAACLAVRAAVTGSLRGWGRAVTPRTDSPRNRS
jgi:hypothetical protein